VSDHPPIRHVQPGSTPLRELAQAIDQALTLPRPATLGDEVVYLRCVRDRGRLVRRVLRRILTDAGTDGDVMDAAAVLRSEAEQIGDDSYEHEPEPS
jgi:hypothetical protein